MRSWEQFAADAGKLNLTGEQLESVHDFYENTDPEFFDAVQRRVPGKIPAAEIAEKFSEKEARMFYFLLIASSWDYLVQLYRQLRYPASMLEDIRNDLRLWCDKMNEDYGYTGLNERIFSWCCAVLNGRILQFGRLQCEFPHSFYGKAALVRENGILQIRNSEVHQPGALVEYGDPVINLHIPAAGPLKRELCLDSLRRMAAFAAEYRPYYRYRGFVCYSWVLDPVFAQLNPKSNLAAFQQLGHLFELPGRDETNEVIWRVFGAKAQAEGIDKLKPVSTMQEKVLAHLKAGGKFREYGFIIPNEELPQLPG